MDIFKDNFNDYSTTNSSSNTTIMIIKCENCSWADEDSIYCKFFRRYMNENDYCSRAIRRVEE